MEPGPHPKIGAQYTPQLAPEMARETGVAIGDDDRWDAMQLVTCFVVVGAAWVVHYVDTLYIDCWFVCILVVTVAP